MELPVGSIYKMQKIIKENTNLPVILCGGAGNEFDFLDASESTDVDALAAGNFFHFKELSYINLKRFLKNLSVMLDIKKYKKILTPTKFCKNCVYPETSAVTLQFDNKGICSGCKVAKNKEKDRLAKKERNTLKGL